MNIQQQLQQRFDLTDFWAGGGIIQFFDEGEWRKIKIRKSNNENRWHICYDCGEDYFGPGLWNTKKRFKWCGCS